VTPAATSKTRGAWWRGAAAAVLILCVGVLWWWRPFGGRTPPPVDVTSMSVTRLTSSGNASAVAISPDGRYVIYALREGELQSLWVRQVATRSDVQVLAPELANYRGLSFSRDGDYVYFVRSDRESTTYSSLYSMPVLGGTPRQLVRDVDTAVTFSPDGQRLAFVRGVPDAGKARLLIANVDGTAEQTLWDADAEINTLGILAPDWSPDGRSIAMSYALLGVGTLAIVNVANKTATTLYRHQGNMGRPRWIPDGTGLLVPLDTLIADRAQVWTIAYPSGAARRFTNDLTDYSRAHFDRTADGRTLAIVSESPMMDLEVQDGDSAGSGRRLTTGGGVRSVSWGGDNVLYYAVGQNIFRRELNESVPRQLTTEGTVSLAPSACGDGSVVYQTFKDDRTAIWRMASDGSNPHIVVRDGNPVTPLCSPDSTWIVYARRGTDQRLAAVRASIDGTGTPTELVANLSRDVAFISPDGSLVGAIAWDGTPPSTVINVVSATGGPIRYALRTATGANNVQFSPDGKSLRYTLLRRGASNIWEQPLTGGPPRQITSFRDQLIGAGGGTGFAWSRGGKQLAVIRGRVATDIVLMSSFNP
jgi:Tol biopolymer transport system component